MDTADPFQKQSNLEHFTELVLEIERQRPYTTSVVIPANLKGAKNAIERLNRLIRDKILTNNGNITRTSRISWLRHKSDIREIQEALKQYRENILTATSANIL